MQRRTFTKYLTAGIGLSTLSFSAQAAKRIILPKRLRTGDTIGLITPGSYLDDAGIEKAVRQIEGLGLRVKPGVNLRAERGFTAGTDAERLADLHAMFADPAVAGIWCARGGYGCGRLLPSIDYQLIRRNPKVLIGYSDITALHNAIFAKARLITYHGPVGSSDFTDYTVQQLRATLFDAQPTQYINLAAENAAQTDPAYAAYTIRSGRAMGLLWGGNLSLLSSLVGTEYVPPVKDNLLFIEDIGEQPYRIDRMLTQLRQAWPLEKAAGLVLGIFRNCEADEGDRSLTLRETLTDRLGNLGIPVAYGFNIGHIYDMCTLPVGATAEVDMDAHIIHFPEPVIG